MRKTLVIWVLVVAGLSVQGQQRHVVDSLAHLAETTTDDSVRVKALNQLAKRYTRINVDTALIFAKQCYKAAMAMNDKDMMANALIVKGVAYSIAGDLDAGLEQQLLALELKREAGNMSGMASILNNLGNLQMMQGDYPGSLGYYMKALRIREKQGDHKIALAKTIGNIGTVYGQLNDTTKAMEYYQRALEIYREDDHKSGIMTMLANIGVIKLSRKEFEEAYDYFKQKYDMATGLNDPVALSSALNGIGLYYYHMGLYDSSLTCYNRAIQLAEQLGDQRKISAYLGNIGLVYIKQENYDAAIEVGEKALQISNKVRSPRERRFALECLYKAYEGIGDPVKALSYHKKFVTIRDSILSEANVRASDRKEMEYEFEKKEEMLQMEQEKKDAITQSELERQQIVGYAFMGGFLLMVILAVVVLRSSKRSKRQNMLIEVQRDELEQKNKEVMDSITYAQRIQEAVLPLKENIKKAFSDAVIFYKPRDLVSGDFYWFAETGQYKVLVVADCTGHGVPGGFMSMLGYEMLQEIALNEDVTKTSDALRQLDHKVSATLNNEGAEVQYQDGMDLAMFAFDTSRNVLQYCGANRPLVMIRDKELTEYKPNKFSIGGGLDSSCKLFQEMEIPYKPGDFFVGYSDGFQDQFGGPKGKKYMHKRLKETILNIAELPGDQQLHTLEQTFESWKGPLEQVDDVCLIGVKI